MEEEEEEDQPSPVVDDRRATGMILRAPRANVVEVVAMGGDSMVEEEEKRMDTERRGGHFSSFQVEDEVSHRTITQRNMLARETREKKSKDFNAAMAPENQVRRN